MRERKEENGQENARLSAVKKTPQLGDFLSLVVRQPSDEGDASVGIETGNLQRGKRNEKPLSEC